IPAFQQIIRKEELGIESAVLHRLFDDDVEAITFQRSLNRLGMILMPLARAIQCLEAKETNPADVYIYWLAIVAQLHDVFRKDDALQNKSKYSPQLRETIRRIVNSRFSELIEDERASNVYLTAFVLDPGVTPHQFTQTRRKPVTVNWRDIRATINQKQTSIASRRSEETSERNAEDLNDLSIPIDPEEDPLKWLDEPLPDLSGFEHRYFDLAAQFEITRYVQILADSIPEATTSSNTSRNNPVSEMPGNTEFGTSGKVAEASEYIPKDDEWGQW
ncbi:hypothetical protein H0H92_009651, partial [Tricholoma furcatifolium]